MEEAYGTYAADDEYSDNHDYDDDTDDDNDHKDDSYTAAGAAPGAIVTPHEYRAKSPALLPLIKEIKNHWASHKCFTRNCGHS